MERRQLRRSQGMRVGKGGEGLLNEYGMFGSMGDKNVLKVRAGGSQTLWMC